VRHFLISSEWLMVDTDTFPPAFCIWILYTKEKMPGASFGGYQRVNHDITG